MHLGADMLEYVCVHSGADMLEYVCVHSGADMGADMLHV